MAEVFNFEEYIKMRPRRLRLLAPIYRILNKFTREWVFSWRMRNRLYRHMGVQLAKDDSGIYIGRETWIDDIFPELVRIDEGVGLGWRCILFVHNTSSFPHIASPIHIKHKALLGHNVTVMPGVTIGEFAQVGCNALVTKDIPPYTVAAGVPAKPLREVKRDEVEMRRV
ncbi:MAG: hypothetical protein GF315_10895 [candidate division Zixibacteria bacterium]|nr:hypothetical protein [candidate division Zixibacteria bacterium]